MPFLSSKVKFSTHKSYTKDVFLTTSDVFSLHQKAHSRNNPYLRNHLTTYEPHFTFAICNRKLIVFIISFNTFRMAYNCTCIVTCKQYIEKKGFDPKLSQKCVLFPFASSKVIWPDVPYWEQHNGIQISCLNK